MIRLGVVAPARSANAGGGAYLSAIDTERRFVNGWAARDEVEQVPDVPPAQGGDGERVAEPQPEPEPIPEPEPEPHMYCATGSW